MSDIEISAQFEQVLRFVNETNQPVFLTGKAGTGKTTLLKYIKQNTFKQMSVIAPTGVAAINAGGSTIHSFFQFPFTPFLPALKDSGEVDFARTHLPTLKYNAQRLAIFRNLELLVIDEVSMVRADLLDQIDITLRQTRRKWTLPFGGVQVLLIGDMYQLPPVVQQEEWQLLNGVYASPFFFDSRVIRENPPAYIELEKIYRQSEATFISLLNKVRTNSIDLESLDLLNSHYKANITEQDYSSNITLTTHNKKADEINARNLAALPGKTYSFKSKVDGIFSDRNFPADEDLVLKQGTRVMFLKNNAEKNYYNGKIGIITYVDSDKIKVKCDEDAYETEVNRETWTNVAYKVDNATKHIEEEILGSFNQYPLRLAWAITIHKSQGLTFDRLIIDAAEAFSAGQVYVALSRCRSLAGLTLSSRISRQGLLSDSSVLHFSAGRHSHEEVSRIFSTAQRKFITTVLLNLFDLSEQVQQRSELAGIIQMHKTRINNGGVEWSTLFFSKIDALQDVSVKFRNQLSAYLDQEAEVESNAALQERIKKASGYFEAELKKCLDDLKNCQLVTESKEAATDINAILQQMADALYFKYALIKSCSNGFVFSEFIKNKLQVIYPDFKPNVYASAKNSKVSASVKHPRLYRDLMLLRDEICNDDQKAIYMVASNKTLAELANYLPQKRAQLMQISGFGEAKTEAYGDRFLKVINDYMSEHGLSTAMEEKAPKKSKQAKEKKPKMTTSFYGSADELPQEQEEKVSSREQTYRLFKQGIKLDEIARQRGYALSTVEGHLIPYIASGELNIDYLVSRSKQRLILDALEDFSYETGLNPVKSKLPADVSFTEIRYVMAEKLRNNA